MLIYVVFIECVAYQMHIDFFIVPQLTLFIVFHLRFKTLFFAKQPVPRYKCKLYLHLYVVKQARNGKYPKLR